MQLLRRLALPLTALVVLVLLPLRRRARRLVLQKSGWVEVRLSGDIQELRSSRDVVQDFVRRLLKRRDPPRVVLHRLRKFVDEVISDAYAKGVLVRLGPLGGGWAAAAAVRAELLKIREAGRHVVVHLEGAIDNRHAMVAAAGTRVVMSPSATMAAAGVAVPGLFLRDALEHLGVRVESISHGRYKSAPDQFTRTERSEPDAEQIRAIVDQFDDALLDSLMAGRVLNRDDAIAMVDQAPMVGAEAERAGFCDQLGRDEDLPETLRALDEREAAPTPIGAATYLQARTLPVIWPGRRRRVGVVRVHGPIIDQAIGLPLPEQQAAVAETVVNDLRAALNDKTIAAVVLHVNSRGGTVTASDAIYSAAKRVDLEKPVIACFGDVAASGGYYVGCGARAIVASPLTLTGSIGVFSLVPTWPQLTQRWSIGHDVVANRKHAVMFDQWAGLDDENRTHAQKNVDTSYDFFVGLVADNRQLSRDEVDAVAEGRVWTGRDARQHRLLDDLGGFVSAVEQAKAEAGGRFDDDPVVVTAKGSQARPGPFTPDEGPTPSASIETALDGGAGGTAPSSWAEALIRAGLVERSGLLKTFDPVVHELLALAWATRGQPGPAMAYAPFNLTR